MCDISIVNLPKTLTGHIIPDLSIASLFGIQVLTEAGCGITFKGACIVKYNGIIILTGEKDPSTDIWTLLLGIQGMTSQHAPCTLLAVAPVIADTHASPIIQNASFAHTVCTKGNSIHFVHQLLCSP